MEFETNGLSRVSTNGTWNKSFTFSHELFMFHGIKYVWAMKFLLKMIYIAASQEDEDVKTSLTGDFRHRMIEMKLRRSYPPRYTQWNFNKSPNLFISHAELMFCVGEPLYSLYVCSIGTSFSKSWISFAWRDFQGGTESFKNCEIFEWYKYVCTMLRVVTGNTDVIWAPVIWSSVSRNKSRRCAAKDFLLFKY